MGYSMVLFFAKVSFFPDTHAACVQVLLFLSINWEFNVILRNIKTGSEKFNCLLCQ